MKQLIAALFAAALCAVPTYGQQKQELTDQQRRMQQCNADAKNKQFKSNEERQAFMSTCLKGEPQKELTAQQKRMGECSKEASTKGMKGEDRDKFMSTCLKAKP